MSTPVRTRTAGFSLVEILLALAVLGLVATMVVVNMGGLTEAARLRSAARKLAGMSDYVRSHAAGAQRSFFLDIDFDHSSYRFRQEPEKDDRGRYIDVETEQAMTEEDLQAWYDSFEWEKLPRDVYFKALFISSRRYFSKQTVEVEYYPSGTLQSFVLHIVGKREEKDAEAYSLVVNGLTGKAELREGLVPFPEAEASEFNEVMGSEAPGTER